MREYFGDLMKNLLDEDDANEDKKLFNDKFVSLKKYLNNINFNKTVQEQCQIETFFKNIDPTCFEIAQKQDENIPLPFIKSILLNLVTFY